MEDSIGRYIVALTSATREHASVLVGSSPRGSLALLLLARARAVMAGRDFVVPEDVKEVAVPALAHRITLRPEMWLRRVDPAFVVEEVLAAVPAPASGALPTYARRVRGAVTDSPLLRTAVPPADEPGEGWAGPAWVPTRALGRTVLLTGLLLVLGVALGRVDLVLLAAPFAIGAAFGLRRLPRSAPEVLIDADDEHLVEGGRVNAVAHRHQPGRHRLRPGGGPHPHLALGRAASGADRPFAISVADGQLDRRSTCPARRCAGAGTRSARRPPGWPPAAGCWPAARSSPRPAACGSIR